MVEQRNVALCVILTIVTCGIYGSLLVHLSCERFELCNGGCAVAIRRHCVPVGYCHLWHLWPVLVL